MPQKTPNEMPGEAPRETPSEAPVETPSERPLRGAPPVALAHTELHRLASTHVGRELEIRVALPVGGAMGPPSGPFGALYVLDGDLYFGTVLETTRLMHQLFGELPPLLVVGIACGTDDPLLQGELRARDFTFSDRSGLGDMGSYGPPGREPALPEGERLGGADPFLDFLTRELQPFIAERYDVSGRDATLLGSSLGGLFTLYALLTRPAAFSGYIAVSPALWWDNGALFELEQRRAAAARDLDARVFLAVGELEEDARVPGLVRFGLVSNTRDMADRLAGRGYPSLRVTSHVFPDEGHTSVVAPAFVRGIRALHGRRQR